MIKICHMLDTLGVGGLEKTALAIASDLKGYEHHIWCLKEKGPLAGAAEENGVRMREFGFRGGLSLGGLTVLVKALKEERFSVIHSHGLYPSMWARPAAIGSRIPVKICHVQNLYDSVTFSGRLKFKALSYSTTKFIAVSDAVRESLVDTMWIPPAKIEVIYNSAPDMTPDGPDLRQKMRSIFGVQGAFIAGGVARLEEHKGYSCLVDAVKDCADRKVDIGCVIAGDGPDRQRLEERVRSLGLQARIKFPGMLDDMVSVLAAFDVLVQPSTIREGLPLSLAEGASAALPLIATPVGGNAEIVADGRNGFIMPKMDHKALAEKLIFLAQNGAESKKMGQQSRRIWQEKFTREEMLQKIDALYRRCIDGRY